MRIDNSFTFGTNGRNEEEMSEVVHSLGGNMTEGRFKLDLVEGTYIIEKKEGLWLMAVELRKWPFWLNEEHIKSTFASTLRSNFICKRVVDGQVS